MRPLTSKKAAQFTESVIREMTRVCAQAGGVNLAQGFPDFPAPEAMKEAAVEAVRADVNQYAVTWGAPRLRDAIARRTSAYNGIATDPERNVTVCCGATEAMISALLAVLDPGDEVIVFEPFYENYGPDCILSGARSRASWRLRAPRLGPSTRPSWHAGLRAAHAGDRRQHPPQPHGQGVLAGGAGAHRQRSAVEHDVLAAHRRDLRVHPLRRRGARLDRSRSRGWRSGP